MKRLIPLVAALLTCMGAPAYALDCQSTIPPINPDTAYQIHANGIVTDTRSGLIWKRCSEGQIWDGGTCSGSPSAHTWEQALALAEGSAFAGHADWRLPNIKELNELVEECRGDPAINNTVFINTTSVGGNSWRVWSGSPHPTALYAWIVDFDIGDTNDSLRSDMHQVRLVRGGW